MSRFEKYLLIIFIILSQAYFTLALYGAIRPEQDTPLARQLVMFGFIAVGYLFASYK